MTARASLVTVALGMFIVTGKPSCLRGGTPPAPSAPPTSSSSSPSSSPSSRAASVDAAAAVTAGDPAAVERSRQWLEDLRWTVEHKATVNPAKAGEGDAVSRCDAVAEARASIGVDAEPAYRKNLDDSAALCAFDVRLVTAREALDRLRYSPSQASRLLQCNVARRELDEARAVHPRDAQLRQLDAHRTTVCH